MTLNSYINEYQQQQKQQQGSVTPTPLSQSGSQQQQQQQQAPQTLSAAPGVGGGDDIRVEPKTLFGIPIGGPSTDQTPPDQTPPDQAPPDQAPPDQTQPKDQVSQFTPLTVPTVPGQPSTSFPPSSDSLTAVMPLDKGTTGPQKNTQAPPRPVPEPGFLSMLRDMARKGLISSVAFGIGFGLSFLPFDDELVDYSKGLVMYAPNKPRYDSAVEKGDKAGNAVQLALILGAIKVLGKEGLNDIGKKLMDKFKDKYSKKAVKGAADVSKKGGSVADTAGESISGMLE